MTVSATNTLRQIAEQTGNDPRGAMLRIIGDYSNFEVAPQKLLVMTYVRRSIRKITRDDGTTVDFQIGGDKTRAEDRFQGKVGLVLKIGPLAFVDDDVHKFGGFHAEVGDWVVFRPSDGLEFFHVADNGRDGVPCRLLSDTHVFGFTDDPEKVF